jgi:hypothetical protein
MKKKERLNGVGGLLVGAGVCIALCAACGEMPEYPDDLPDSRSDGSVKPDGGSDESDTSYDGPGIKYNPVKANVMLLVDRSGSMAEPADCGLASCPSKWEQLLSLGAYLAEASQLACLGLAVFPSPEYNGCEVSGGILVPLSCDSDVDERIMDAVARVVPGGRTPVASALDELRLFGGLDDPERDSTVVILTDGKPNCACGIGDVACERDEAVAAVLRLENSDPPVDIDVIGFGASAREAHDTLYAMAQAAGDENYYQSDTIEDLIGTMYQIGAGKTPCTFYLDEWPEPDRLIVWMDDVQVPPCQTDPCESGYTYDQSEGVVEFHGTTCAALRDGERHHVWFDALP